MDLWTDLASRRTRKHSRGDGLSSPSFGSRFITIPLLKFAPMVVARVPFAHGITSFECQKLLGVLSGDCNRATQKKKDNQWTTHQKTHISPSTLYRYSKEPSLISPNSACQ